MSQEPVSLSDIDPRLGQTDDTYLSPEKPTNDDPTESDAPKGKGKGKKASNANKKKTKGMQPGSTADYKRKEANRLAAERSRQRQAEHRASLHEAAKRLRTEQTQLKAEIARLEREAVEGVTFGFNEEQDVGKAQGSNESPVGVGVGVGVGMSNEAMEAEAEAQAHSRTILAALMSDAEIDQALVGQWMDQVGHGTEGEGPSTSNTTSHAPTDQTLHTQTQPDSRHRDTRSPSMHSDNVPPEPAKPNGMGVALHAEMERHLREDLAATKIAIDQIGKEFMILRGEMERPIDEENLDEITYIHYNSPLPPNSYSMDEAVLSGIVESLEAECLKVTNELPGLKEQLVELKESRIAEAERLKTLLAGLNISEDDRIVVDKLLKPLSTHLDDLLIGLAPEKADALHAILGSTLAPAIAPRRRGRPPRHPAVARQRAPRNKKSKLSHQLEMDQDQDHDSNPQDTPQHEEQQHQQQPEMELQNIPEPHTHTHAQGEMTTEELISQLANHDDQDLRDLLSSHAENEYAAQHISAHLQNQLDNQPNPLDTPTHHHHMGHGESSTGHQNMNHQVVHFKQGPPGSCDICSRTQTTVWRKVNVNGEDLHVCNPCGMYHIKTGQIRPPELWGDGKLIRKRRKSTHPRNTRDENGKRFKSQEGLELGLLDSDEEEGEVGNLGEVDHEHEHEHDHDHDDFRATLGIEGISEIMKEFGDGVGVGDVEQDVANVFGSVE